MIAKILSSPAAWVQASTLEMVGATVHLQGEALMSTLPHPRPGARRQEVLVRQAVAPSQQEVTHQPHDDR